VYLLQGNKERGVINHRVLLLALLLPPPPCICLVLTVLRPWVSQVLREHKTRSSNLHVVKLPHELVTHPLGVLSLVSTCQSVSIMSIGKTQHEM
jgi:hypothetical protein